MREQMNEEDEEGKEEIMGGLSSGYKNFITENDIADETYNEDGTALFRVQGSGPDNMQAIQVEAVASSLNSSYCFILHGAGMVFSWSGTFTTSEDQELVERQLDLIKPTVQPKPQKEGTETEQFWDLLGGKCEFPSQKITRAPECDPHLFFCTLTDGNLKVKEIFSFDQDDLMTEDIFILDCHSDIFVWVGLQVNAKIKSQALYIGEKFLERDFLLEKLSREAPIFIVMEGSEPQFFTRFFTWDSAKSAMHGNSYERRLAIIKNGRAAALDKPKRRIPVHGGRSSEPDKSQRSRSMSFSPDKARLRHRSPAFNVLAATFENPNARNLSMPPPLDRKIYPKSVNMDSIKLSSRSEAIAALTATFEPQRQNNIPRSPVWRGKSLAGERGSPRTEDFATKEDVKDGEADEEEKFPIFPYERLKISSTDPVTEIDITKREAYLSVEEFREKFDMTKNDFYKLPKWKQNKLKMAIHLF